jgi:hypothetical protein
MECINLLAGVFPLPGVQVLLVIQPLAPTEHQVEDDLYWNQLGSHTGVRCVHLTSRQMIESTLLTMHECGIILIVRANQRMAVSARQTWLETCDGQLPVGWQSVKWYDGDLPLLVNTQGQSPVVGTSCILNSTAVVYSHLGPCTWTQVAADVGFEMTIVIPIWAHAPLLMRRCIESILSQNYPVLRIVLSCPPSLAAATNDEVKLIAHHRQRLLWIDVAATEQQCLLQAPLCQFRTRGGLLWVIGLHEQLAPNMLDHAVRVAWTNPCVSALLLAPDRYVFRECPVLPHILALHPVLPLHTKAVASAKSMLRMHDDTLLRLRICFIRLPTHRRMTCESLLCT